MKLAVLDFETYFSDDYTLKKMTTEAYVRDRRFKTHCVGIKAMDKLPDAQHIAQPTMTMNHETFTGMVSKVPDYAVVMHKAAFDGLILNHWYGVQPAFYFDTLSMARLVFPHDKSHSLESLAAKFGYAPKSVPYNEFRGVRDLPPDIYNRLCAGCAHDVELTYLVFRNLLPLIPREELRIIDMTVKMFTRPLLRLDRPMMEAYHAKVKAEKETVLDQLGVTKDDLQSADKFAELLRQLGVDPPTKSSPSNPDKKIYAFAKTDEAMKELVDDEDNRVSALCAARLGQKSTLNETRCERLLSMDSRGALTVPLRYYGAGASSRFSGEDKVNFQNFPRSGEIRNCIIAPEGQVLLIGDLSQIECRMLNWLAGEEWVLQAFREGRDLYCETASEGYGRVITKADKMERGMGKQIVLSCGFGSGGPKIAITARRGTYGPPVYITNEEGTRWRDLYRGKHKKVVSLWWQGADIMNYLFNGNFIPWGPMFVKDKKLYGPNGSWLDYSNLVFKGVQKGNRPDFAVMRRNGESRIYGSKFIQNVIEFLCRILLEQAILRVPYPCVMQTHDECVFLVPVGDADRAAAILKQELTTVPAWCPGIPLEAEVGYDVRYSK